MSPHVFQAVLLVDGYNIIGAWSRLKQISERHGLESARRDLVEILINYTAHQGYRTQVVFDAHYQDTPSYSEEHTSNLLVYYTAFAQTADTYIEKFCATFARSRTSSYSRLIVATSDRAQQLTVVGYGAEWMSAAKLGNEVETVNRQIGRKNPDRKRGQSRFLFNSLDADAQKLLSQWRQGGRSQ